ncbi:MAG: TIGR02221 family CRISPR-associated protein [Anaerolineae bacterium]|nr:TIGR02221 family CRISPR-associated protein [Anaerolineae bacterium]
MNLLTFLGTASYSPTTYTLADKQHTTCYCPAAVAHFYRPDTTLVVVTDAAKAKHFETLADEISAVTRPVAVSIPDGHSEADLWQIFEALTEHVKEKDELIVDITNGFRSLPFLSFLAIAFLRLARQVTVQNVFYGAWDARNEANESPIFDLTPFVTLLDWTIATDRFTRFGDASDLADLLRAGMPPGPLMGKDLEARALGHSLKDTAKAMENVSLALRLTRPLETMTSAAHLTQTLAEVGPRISQTARPYGLLARQIQTAYQPLALAGAPLARENWPVNLQIQLDLVERYLTQGQIVQAVTLAREWLVSLLVYRFEAGSMTDYEGDRKPVELALSNVAERVRGGSRPPRHSRFDAALQALPDHQEIGKLWADLTHLRNDMAHVGMKSVSSDAVSLRRRAEALYPRLSQIGQTLLAEVL